MATDHPRIVIVGGVAGGASSATRARRMNEQAEIILLEKDEHVSFANCGLPYYLGGEIASHDKILVATPEFLARRFRIDVRTRHKVTRIDRSARAVEVQDRSNDRSYMLEYDKLILAPGASPIVPPIPGIDAPNVFTLRNVADMDGIGRSLSEAEDEPVIVVGAGFIGLEMVEQLERRGRRVTLVELQSQVLPVLDSEMAEPLEVELKRRGVTLHLGAGLAGIDQDEQGEVRGVELSDGTRLSASMVVLGIGVKPNVDLAADAGLFIGSTGGITTDEYQRTNDPDIYAVGDAVEYGFGPTGDRQRIPLAGPANRAGRLAGQHAATGQAHPMPPVMGTAIVRVFDQVAGLTGLTVRRAGELDVPCRSVTIIAAHHAGYYPDARPITLKLVYNPDNGQILGAQAVGEQGVDKRLDVIATAMSLRATVWDLAGVDLAYAPPFGSAKDPVHMAAFAACNQLDGITDFVDANADLTGMQVLDVRTPAETERLAFDAEEVINIPLDDLRDRLDELDPTRPTAVTCHSSLRAHVASRILRQTGFSQVQVVSGGTVVRSRT